MKSIHLAEDKRLMARMAVVSAAALAAMVILSLVMAAYVQRSLQDTYASVIGAVAQKYPLAEAQVVSDLRSPASPSTRSGYQILQKYGLEDADVGENGLPVRLLVRLLPLGLLLSGLTCAAYILLLMRYRRSVDGQVAELSNYLSRLEAGDYSLDIRDNDEGSLSLLKNDLYKITVRLREQAELLQKDKRILSDGIADISHQIKTPLTALGVLVDLLAEDPPEADRNEFIDRLRSQVGRIQWLVSALLKLARLDAGTVTFKCEPVNILQMVRQAIEPLKIPLEIKKQRLEIQGAADAVYPGDFNWSAEALTNIVKNCVEHTPEGGKIEIAFEVNNLYAEITVSDDGEGIAEQDLPKLFNRFYRGQNAGENSVGIGLALANAIFEAQGGDISVRSDMGMGACFSIRVFRGVV